MVLNVSFLGLEKRVSKLGKIKGQDAMRYNLIHSSLDLCEKVTSRIGGEKRDTGYNNIFCMENIKLG